MFHIRRTGGFTLIELLVVVSIIVVLIAMLLPALEKAIYQTELTVCGTHIRGITTGVQVYAAGNKRRYPVRFDGQPVGSPNQLLGRVGFNGTNTWSPDARKAIRDFISINGLLNDPLTRKVNLDNNSTSDNVIYGPYDLWYGFQFANDPTGPAKAMYRMGDKWSWKNQLFDVVAADFSCIDNGYGSQSHADKEGVSFDQVYDGTSSPFVANSLTPITATFSWWAWEAKPKPRGPVDLNFCFQDGSVKRYNDVPLQGAAAKKRGGLFMGINHCSAPLLTIGYGGSGSLRFFQFVQERVCPCVLASPSV